MFGKPVIVQSLAADHARARAIGTFLNAVFHANGGVAFFQDLALLGAVYGFVDVILRTPDDRRPRRATADPADHANRLLLDVVAAPTAVPAQDAGDYRKLDAYLLHYRRQLNRPAADTFLHRLRHRLLPGHDNQPRRATITCTETWTTHQHRLYHGQPNERRLLSARTNRLGRIPVVHIQNLGQPFFYDGLSEVEPLIPLQDELNTRLSDRANRVTFQSFKMYLGKGIDQFIDRPVGPGQMWQTDNPEASIQEFGGDGASPSEEAHIREIREAMDKASGVTPVAAGLIGGKIGNLTSENALRVTLLGLLAKTEKKRVTYGAGIAKLCELILHAAHVHGLLTTRPEERRIRLDWPGLLPENEAQRLRDAQLKIELGVPRQQVLAELGYANCNDA